MQKIKEYTNQTLWNINESIDAREEQASPRISQTSYVHKRQKNLKTPSVKQGRVTPDAYKSVRKDIPDHNFILPMQSSRIKMLDPLPQQSIAVNRMRISISPQCEGHL